MNPFACARRMLARSTFLLLLGACSAPAPAFDASVDARSMVDAATGADTATDLDASTPTGVCAEQSSGTTADGDPVTICTRFHDAAPLVRLPPDSTTELYGSIDMGSFRFTTRDGVAHAMTSADGVDTYACEWTPTAGCVGGSAFDGARGPTHRWLFTLYRATGSLDGETLRVTDIEPVVLVRGEAIDSLLERPFEGTISRRLVPRTAGDPASSPIFAEGTAPIRIEPTGSTVAFDLETGDETVPDATARRVVFEIANLAEGVTLGDGTCASALQSLGDESPFVGGTTSTLTAERDLSMHAVGGHHIVIGRYPEGALDIGSTAGEGPNAMSEGLEGTHPLVSPWTWLAPTLDLVSGLTDRYGLHGNIFVYNLAIELHPATGGGAPCTP